MDGHTGEYLVVEGWRLNPPRNWPRPPEGWTPARGWRPDPAWGPLPPGHRLWLPSRPQRRPRGPAVLAGLGTVVALAVAGLVPASGGDPSVDGVEPAGGALRPALVAPVRRPEAPVAVTVTPGPASPPSPEPSATPTATPQASTSPSLSKSQPEKRPLTRFTNCANLRRVYPHGVGRRGATDRTAGKPVTTFRRDARLYAANIARDGDRDGIACERE
jgi:hypothetical protein